MTYFSVFSYYFVKRRPE